jgi:prevent-host-death family protein
MAWQLQQAKQQFSRLVDSAIADGPQVVTRHGREAVVVMSVEDYRRLKGSDAVRALLTGPKSDALADILDEVVEGRSADLPREVAL